VSHPELIEALRKAAEERAAAIWDAARAEADRCRSEAGGESASQRERAAEEDAAAAKALSEAAMAEAEHEASRIVLAARVTLGERVYGIARAALPRFRDGGYRAMFEALADEIPGRAWPRVRVNPADSDLARHRFPDAEILADDDIVAGLVVEDDDGRIRIDNTLETRLARAWPQILPGIVGEAMKEAGH
jgi:vacuolar-type H+-ATPase subunit E/Vma4